MTVLLIGAVAALVSGFVQGCTGFGMGLIAASALMLFLQPVEAVPIVLLMSTVNTSVAAVQARQHIRFGLVAPIALGALIGMPLGIYALKSLDADLFKVFVGGFVLCFALLLLSGWRKALPDRFHVLAPLGVVSGFLGGSTSMSGPPIILFLANQQTPKDIFRASLLAYFFTLNCLALVVFRFSGLLSGQAFRYAALFMIPMLLGTFAGMRLVRHVPEALFRKIAIFIVAIMGVTLLAAGIQALVRT